MHTDSTSVGHMMSPRTRLLWLLALFLAQLLYFPINRTMSGGIILDTRWDDLVPLWPAWAVPYLLGLLWWTGCYVWAAWKMEDSLYRAFAAGFLLTSLTSYVVYILYPTYIQRPVVDGTGWQFDLVRFIYANDRLYNAFPSGHAYTTLLITFFWIRWYPRQTWLWMAIAIIILLSTLFTGQHNLPDPFGGAVWAWMGYRFGLWWSDRRAGSS